MYDITAGYVTFVNVLISLAYYLILALLLISLLSLLPLLLLVTVRLLMVLSLVNDFLLYVHHRQHPYDFHDNCCYYN